MGASSSDRQLAKVVVVGSGIAGLICAHAAASSGYLVQILSKSADPRYSSIDLFGSSTWDGWCNRFITLTEGHPYLDLQGYVSTMYPDIANDFCTDLTQGGMLALPRDQWDAASAEFLAKRSQANQDQLAVLALFLEYLDENRASMKLWYEFLTNAIDRDPRLLQPLSLHADGIDRFYDEHDLFLGALWAQQAEEIVKATYSVETLRQHPDFTIYQSGLTKQPFIQGGGLTMYGLAFDVKSLGCWLLDQLEQQGVGLNLGAKYEVKAIERTAGAVTGLQTADGSVHSATHYFLHPGAYCPPEVLPQTIAGSLAGVKGLWLRIKDAQKQFRCPPPRPNKIHGRKYIVTLDGQNYPTQVADLNVMPKCYSDDRWDLIVGAGYLFTGIYPFLGSVEYGYFTDTERELQRANQIRQAEALALRAFVQVVEQIYDLAIDFDRVIAGTDPDIDLPSHGCIRSWTVDDRELRWIEPTASGGIMLIEGGGNTGSTTKAQFLSQVAIEFARKVEQGQYDPADLPQQYESIRAANRQTKAQITTQQWAALELRLHQAIAAAIKRR